jgi:glyoxylase-like metal-dependent hydrolase (beta-lactamase superfamily II)
MWKLNVKIIKTGSCTIDPGNVASAMFTMLKNQIGVGGGSTVTLIKEEDELLLIDTGYERESDLSQKNKESNYNLLITLLQSNGINPADINKIFITHSHVDHYGGIEYFKNAKWYCYHQTLDDLDDPIKDKFITLNEDDQVIPNTIVLHTPGHTKGHSSILWSDENKSIRVAISGDAIINLAWLQSGYIWKFNGDFYDTVEAKKSIKRLLNLSDIIIPGHGQPFFSTRRLKGLI